MAKRRRPHSAPDGKEVFEAQAAFRLTLREFLRFSEASARTAGLTQQQYQTLLTLHGVPGRDSIRVGELAARLQVRHHSAVGVVDLLAARGLVVRERAPTDRRVVLLRVTPRGLRLLRRVSTENRQELRRLRPRLLRFLRQLGTRL